MSVAIHEEHGFTLLEVLVALLIFGFVAAGALTLTRQQNLAFSSGASKMDALQNYRFASDLLERNLAATGNNVAPGQPFLVYADSSTLAFNGDYAASDANDYFATYIDQAATAAETGGLTAARQITIPGSAFSYPTATYQNGTVTTSAETITFYFEPDETTVRAEDFVLMRKVNDQAAEVVARNVVKLDNDPFFAYQEEFGGDTIPVRSVAVPASALPLRHTAQMHLSGADTGSVARVDKVRSVRVAFGTVSGKGVLERTTSFRRVVRMPNAGEIALRTCGEDPIFSSSVSAVQTVDELRIEVSWTAAFDESSGENDVIRYAIFRRMPPESDWGEPYFSIPAGQSTYVYADTDVEDGASYQYAVAAQDCTPTMSTIRISNALTVAL